MKSLTVEIVDGNKEERRIINNWNALYYLGIYTTGEGMFSANRNVERENLLRRLELSWYHSFCCCTNKM